MVELNIYLIWTWYLNRLVWVITGKKNRNVISLCFQKEYAFYFLLICLTLRQWILIIKDTLVHPTSVHFIHLGRESMTGVRGCGCVLWECISRNTGLRERESESEKMDCENLSLPQIPINKSFIYSSFILTHFVVRAHGHHFFQGSFLWLEMQNRYNCGLLFEMLPWSLSLDAYQKIQIRMGRPQV